MKLSFSVVVVLGLALAGSVSGQSSSSASGIPQIYQHWLDEDVRYIMSTQERAEFLTLKSDESRDNFVRVFWERRNPAPGSSENKFKEEHYRRLAYANVHFASNAPGWQSDRGQVYIVDGPPDEITSSQESNQNVETWRYTSTGGNQPPHEVKFVDRCNCGEYVRER